MSQTYNIYLVPKIEDRKKISKLRQEICKKTYSTQALQYPVHLSLTAGTKIKDYLVFEKELINLCKKLKQIKLIPTKKTTDILKEFFWTGISFEKNLDLIEIQKQLEDLKNKHSLNKREIDFKPHITLSYPPKVDDLKPSFNPVNELIFDKITIAIKKDSDKKYTIYKHYKLKV